MRNGLDRINWALCNYLEVVEVAGVAIEHHVAALTLALHVQQYDITVVHLGCFQ